MSNPSLERGQEEIAAILRDNIHFSGQVGDYVIHGAIEKLMERERLLIERSIKQWEYITDKFYPYQNDMVGWLNGYGEQGWELVSDRFTESSTSYSDEYYTFIFKRPNTHQP